MNVKHTLFGIFYVILSTAATATPLPVYFRTTTAMNHAISDITGLYPQITNALQSHFMADEVRLVRGSSADALQAAQYSESGPLIAVVIAEDQSFLYIYLETCDICAVMARASKTDHHVETLKQAHSLTCSDLKHELVTFQIQSSICDSADR